MNKPFVVCHMLTSIDGKIEGKYMSDPRNERARKGYGELREFYKCQGTLYGTTTMKECYADGSALNLKAATEPLLREDYRAPSCVDNFIVSVDPDGTLGFSSGVIEKKGRKPAHVIEVLTSKVSDDYLVYLQERGVSYIFCGSNHLDCSLMLHKLKAIFGIERLMASGGGIMNGSLLNEDLIDEVSIVVSPLIDGNTHSASIFDRLSFLPDRKPAAFSLLDIKRVGDVIWLRYIKKKDEI